MKENDFQEYLVKWEQVYPLLKVLKPNWKWRNQSILQCGVVIHYLEIVINENMRNIIEDEDITDHSCVLDDVTITTQHRGTMKTIHILLHPNYQTPCPYILQYSLESDACPLWILDEHPLLGVAALTIHPCGLEERLSILSGDIDALQELYFLQWFGLLGPLFDFQMSPEFFAEASSILRL